MSSLIYVINQSRFFQFIYILRNRRLSPGQIVDNFTDDTSIVIIQNFQYFYPGGLNQCSRQVRQQLIFLKKKMQFCFNHKILQNV